MNDHPMAKKQRVESGFIDDVLPLERLGFIGVYAGGVVDRNATGFPIVRVAKDQVPLHLIPRRVKVTIELCEEKTEPLELS